MCPICEGETLAQSDSPAAQRIKRSSRRGSPPARRAGQIKRELVASAGRDPGRAAAAGLRLLAWLLPIVGIVGGAPCSAPACSWTPWRDPAGAAWR
jgi:cytochrome c-type biogenesis protein CcmH/NrfF